MNLSDAWDYFQKVEAICPDTSKQLPLRIINSSLDATYRYLSSLVDDSPSASVSAILCQLGSLSTTLTTQLLPRFRPEFLVNHNDSAFRLLEHFEATIVENTIRALIARHPTQSLMWLHDGFLVAPLPPEQMVRQIEKEVLSKHQLYFGQTWFKVTSLTTARNAYVDPSSIPPAAMPYPSPVVHPTAPNVNSAVFKNRHTSAPLPWKPLPNCVLDANARRE